MNVNTEYIRPTRQGISFVEITTDTVSDSPSSGARRDTLAHQIGLSASYNDQAGRWLHNGWDPSLEYYLRSRARDRRCRLSMSDNDSATWSDEECPSIALPQHPSTINIPYVDLLISRRSVRGFSGKSAQLADLSRVLQMSLLHGSGVSRSLLIGVIAYRIDDLAPGVYTYSPKRNALSLRRSGDYSLDMVEGLQGMPATKTAAFTLIVFLDVPHALKAFRDDATALRRVYVESGVALQRACIAARSASLEGFVTPAQKDSKVMSMFDVDSDSALPIHTFTAGRVSSHMQTRWP